MNEKKSNTAETVETVIAVIGWVAAFAILFSNPALLLSDAYLAEAIFL